MNPSRAATVALVGLFALTVPAGADFRDNDYHEFILNDWDTAELDVFIFPGAAPEAAARLAAMQQSIAAWDAGIDDLGDDWFVAGFRMNVYTVGVDTPPAAALADPEIFVISAEFNPVLLFGIGAGWDSIVCDEVDNFATILAAGAGPATIPAPVPAAWHQHLGSPWAVRTTACEGASDNVCVALNTNFAFSDILFDESGQFSMYDLVSHEFGHCLGIGHVGDAGDFDARNFPHEDIMSYQSNQNQVHCVSSLNLKALHGVYAQVLGRPEAEWIDGPDFVHMTPSQYSQTTCANP